MIIYNVMHYLWLLGLNFKSSYGYDTKNEPPPPKIKKQPLNEWDYIVVGAGAAGIPAAYQIAQKSRVLLLERGPERMEHEDTWTYDGVGRNLSAPGEGPTTQIRTSSGVISHVGNVIGGGTGVNMGYLLSEGPQFWEWYKNHYGFDLDVDEFMDSHEFVLDYIGYPVDDLEPYSTAYKIMLKEKYAPYSDKNSTRILEGGGTFRGTSLFDDTNKGKRVLLDTLLTEPKIPRGLDVRSNIGVTRIHFIKKPYKKAICVSTVRNKSQADTWKLGNIGLFKLCDVPVLRHVPFLCTHLWHSVRDDGLVFGLPQGPVTPYLINSLDLGIHPPLPTDRDSYCLGGVVNALKNKSNDFPKEAGIVLSAGPVFTPLVLQNSGIGPVEDVPYESVMERDESVFSQIGRHMNDRLMTFIAYFSRNVETVRIGTGVGMIFEGKCDQNVPNGTDEAGDCTPLVIEDLGGQGLALSVVLATRAIFPMSVREDPLVMLLTQIIEVCITLNEDVPRIPYIADSPLLLQYLKVMVCPLTNTTVSCFKEGRGIFTMQSQPQSRGYVSLREQDDDSDTVFVHMPYLEKKADRDLIVKSIRHLLESISENESFESSGRANTSLCPFPIISMSLSFFSGTWIPAPIMRSLYFLAFGNAPESVLDTSNLWDMVTTATMESEGMDENVLSLEEAMSIEYTPRMLTIEESVEILSAMEASSKHWELEGLIVDPDGKHVPMAGLDALTKWKVENLGGDGIHESYNYRGKDHTEGNARAFKQDGENIRVINEGMRFDKDQMRAIIDDEVPNSRPGELWVNRNSLTSLVPWLSSEYLIALKNRIDNGSTFLLFPGIPDLTDEDAILQYAINFSLSLWHWNGSVMRSELGPVDKDFKIKNLADNLFIADASVLPALPRMNPQLTLMALGHYAGTQIVQGCNRQCAVID